MRMELSLLTTLQLSISVKARLMLSLTSKRRCSSAEISYSVSSSGMVSRATEPRRFSHQPLYRAWPLVCLPPSLRRECLLGACGRGGSSARLGDDAGDDTEEALLNDDWRGRI